MLTSLTIVNYILDDSKIGQKMLEKMGWKKGSGLGLKENGEAEPIKVLTKSDRKGMSLQLILHSW
jgi:Pin2-interacting protein X1